MVESLVGKVAIDTKKKVPLYEVFYFYGESVPDLLENSADVVRPAPS